MNSAASIEVKGWCPGALRPMLSGDGLIVRIRPFCGAFSLEQARGLADLARWLTGVAPARAREDMTATAVAVRSLRR